MVSVVMQLQGGLGNQLFQYCAAVTVAEIAGTTPQFELRPPTNREVCSAVGLPVELSPQPRSGALASRYGLERPVSRIRELWNSGLSRMNLAQSVAQQNGPSAFGPIDDELPIRAHGTVRLRGRFQHSSWFDPVIDTVAPSIANFLDERIGVLLDGDYTAVSFRRGDYTKLGWSLPLAYYASAHELIDAAQPVVVIGDDLDFTALGAHWFRTHGFEAHSAQEVGADGVLDDLALIARASSVVMSNSTFCWWGTTLGDYSSPSPTRRVLFPEPWMTWLNDEEGVALRRASWEALAWRRPGGHVSRAAART